MIRIFILSLLAAFTLNSCEFEAAKNVAIWHCEAEPHAKEIVYKAFEITGIINPHGLEVVCSDDEIYGNAAVSWWYGSPVKRGRIEVMTQYLGVGLIHELHHLKVYLESERTDECYDHEDYCWDEAALELELDEMKAWEQTL